MSPCYHDDTLVSLLSVLNGHATVLANVVMFFEISAFVLLNTYGYQYTSVHMPVYMPVYINMWLPVYISKLQAIK